MWRTVGYLLIAVAFFAGTVAMLMRNGGYLNVDAMTALMSNEVVEPVSVSAADPLAPYTDMLSKREAALTSREADIAEREQRLRQRERALEDTLKEVAALRERVEAQVATLDAENTKRLEKVAEMVGAMTPSAAAEDLQAMPPWEAADILVRIGDRAAGRILDAMAHESRLRVHETMQQRGD